MGEDEIRRLFDECGTVDALQFDDELKDHLEERGHYEKHDVTLSEISEVHAGNPAYFLNAGGRRAPVIMVGVTLAGRTLCVPLEPGPRQGVWRPVTAFEANAHHRLRYEGARKEGVARNMEEAREETDGN